MVKAKPKKSTTKKTKRASETTPGAVSIPKFIAAIRKLPEDEPFDDPGVWYRTQKEHWIGWLRAYGGPGAYGRKIYDRDARFAYNHIVNDEMLLWLVAASGVGEKLTVKAYYASRRGKTMMQRAGAVRKIVPWEMIVEMLWPEAKPVIGKTSTRAAPAGRQTKSM